MNRLALSRCKAAVAARRGYTLIEILVATALSLLILGAVVQLFGTVGNSISQSRSFLESSERLRTAQTRLQADLKGLTVSPLPPVKPEENRGYLEIIESPIVQGPKGVYAIDYRLITKPNAQTGFTCDAVVKPVDSSKPGMPLDSTVGDTDILMLTTKSKGKPFSGKLGGTISVESEVAEVAWFVRGRTLYRRQLLVAPELINMTAVAPFMFAMTDYPAALPAGITGVTNPDAQGFYANYDISVRAINVLNVWKVVPNTLSDLTRRECRFAHPGVLPNDVRPWSYLGLPTSKETSDLQFCAGVWDTSRIASGTPAPNVMDLFFSKRSDLRFRYPNNGPFYPMFDSWTNDRTARLSDSELIKDHTATPPTTYQGSAIADDVILTNVIGFDIKVWDPGAPILQATGTGRALYPGDPLYILPGDQNNNYNANLDYTVVGFGAYVDMGYFPSYDPSLWQHQLPCPAAPQPLFHDDGESMFGGSILNPPPSILAHVYDTGCFSSEYSGTAIDGFDNGALGAVSIIDNDAERPINARSPYPHPLRGVQIKIRIFEPDSRQIREVTIEQDFLPK